MAYSRKTLMAQKLDKTRRIWCYVCSLAILFALMSVVIWRLYVLQIKDTETYKSLASAQQLKDEPILAERGDIYDATGKLLATNNVVWDVVVDPRSSEGLYNEFLVFSAETGEEETEREFRPEIAAEISTGIAKIFVANDGSTGENVDVTSEEYIATYNMIYEKMSKSNSYYEVLAKDVDLKIHEAVVDYMRKFNDEYHDGKVFVFTEQNAERMYPYSDFAAAILGFCNADGIGTYGLEKSYESVLAGVDGRLTAVQNVRGQLVANEPVVSYEPQDGQSLGLYLDVYVQEVVEKYLEEAIMANDVENRGAAIVMDVNTGGIIAMASKPDYDPNEPYSIFNPEYMEQMVLEEPEIYAKYLYDESGSKILDQWGYPKIDLEADYSGTYRDLQWKNKNITELYYPGSVFKIFTAAMAIDTGLANQHTRFTCTGSHNVAGTVYRCAGGKVHGTQDMAQATRNSCNIYFIKLAEALGAQRFYDYFNSFGFTGRTGVDLPFETNYMQYYNENALGPVELASSGFGQAMAMTSLQLSTAMASLVNGGYLVTPQIVNEIYDSNGNVVYSHETEYVRQAVSKNTSDIIRYLLEYEVGYGTNVGGGYRSYVSGYRIGGKTGTSEQLNMDLRLSDGDYKKTTSYVAVLPIDNPKYLVYVMLDDPNNPETDYASALVAPVAGNIISEIAPYLGIEASGTDLSGEMVKVPNIVGDTWTMGQVELNALGLKHNLIESENVSSVGAKITYQYPEKGTEVLSGTTIYTYVEGESGVLSSVPDVMGKTANFASQLLKSAGFNVSIIGDENMLVTSQSIVANEQAQKGTIITIVCEG